MLGKWESDILQDDNGDAIVVEGATVEVRLESDNSLATLWQDIAGTIALDNPFTVAGTNILFYASSDESYRIEITKDTFSRTLRNEAVKVFEVVTLEDAQTITGVKTLDANLNVGTNTAAHDSVINGPAESSRHLFFRTAGANRWVVSATIDAESGSDAGSDFLLFRYNDAGGTIGQVLRIRRSDGAAQVGLAPTGGYQGAEIWNFKAVPQVNGVPVATGISSLVRIEASSANASSVNVDAFGATLTTLDLGTVVAGDRILITAKGSILKGATQGLTTLGVGETGAGTATIKAYDGDNFLQNASFQEASTSQHHSLSGVMKVTVGGTLTIRLFAQSAGSDSTCGINDGALHALVLKA